MNSATLALFNFQIIFCSPFVIWTVYLDDSGTHDDSPIMLMGGFLANAAQWESFNNEWQSLLTSFGIPSCHAVELRHRTKQFKGWSVDKRKEFILEANRITEEQLELAVTTIIRKDDYDSIYKSAPNPKKLRKDSKFGVLFRGCLSLIVSAVTTDLELAKQSTINFVLEDGAKNSGDAVRLFDLAKSNNLPEWSHLLGSITRGQKQSYGLQAADLVVYFSNIAERTDHRDKPTEIENSSHILSQGDPIPAFKYYRMPIRKKSLTSLQTDFLLPRDQWVNMQSR
jgi:hypothetical protein